MYATKFIECGHAVEAVSDAAEGLRRIKETEYDIVLLDVVMPAVSGLDLLKEVTASGLRRKTKFVILSNQSETTDRAAADQIGVDGYIVKAESVPSDVVRQSEAIFKQ